MKSVIKNTVINAFALLALSSLVSGVKISGGILTFIIGGLILYLMTLFLKPILKIITIPINAVTFGTFSFVIDAIFLYLLTVLVSNISVTPFKFDGLTFLGFVVPNIHFNSFFAFLVSSIVLFVIITSIKWLMKK